MDMDDDDIYGDDDEYVPQEATKMQDVDEGEEEGEEVEDDSDDDINFITDSKQDAKPESTSQQKSQTSQNVRDQDGAKASGTPQPQNRSEHTPQPSVNRTATPLDDSRPGTEYPARHTSTLDPMNGNPVHPVTGKPIMESDLDTDFGTESTKPWRKPGADITDYFNYGFDEFTWASWCLKKQQMPSEVKQINQETEQMKAFVDGIGSGGMPQMPGANSAGGMPQMPGMPSEQDMAQMMQAMMSQGVDVTQMDQNQFMQMMMGGAGGAGNFQQGQQPPSGPAGFGGNNAGGGFQDGYSGRGRGRGGRRNWQ